MTDTITAISRSLSADITTLNTISHNIANMNTPGYRAERTVASFEAQVGGGAKAAFDQADGPLAQTGRSLDLALRGKGFFAVERNGETLLTRGGQFRLDGNGRLVNAHGDAVLADGGELVLADEHVRVDAQGEIWSGERSLGRLQLIAVADPSRLVALDASAFRYTGPVAEWQGVVQQGAVEQANVDAADESIRLMELTRHVESVQRAISIYDKAMDTGINRLGDN